MNKTLKRSALSSVLSLLLAGAAHAAVFDYSFSVSSDGWFDTTGEPFGMPYSPSLTGTVQVDNSFSGFAAVTGFSFMTGSKTWSLAEVGLGALDRSATFDGLGDLTEFHVVFSDSFGQGHVYSNNTVGITDYSADAFNACSGCVTLGPGVPVAPVPEPETYALMLAGLGLLGLVARRRKLLESA